MKTVMPYCYSSDKSRMEEVAPDVFRLDMPMPQAIGSTNSYLIKASSGRSEGDESADRSLIIDAGCNNDLTKKTYDEALSKLGIRWEEVDVFITHFHWDHWAGLDQIWQPSMKVYAGVDSVTEHGVPVMAAEEVGAIERSVSAYYGIQDSYDPEYWKPMTLNGEKDIPLTRVHEGDRIKVGRYNFSVLETPGHDLHHCCLFDEESKILISGDQMLYNQHPPIMMESDVDQLGLLLETIERLATLDADLVLCGHGDPGSNLTQRCAQVIDHYHRQLVSFKQVCEGGETDPGKLAYLSTHQGKRTPWEDRLIFGRRALIAQTMAYLKHLMQTGELPETYEIVPLR